MSEIIEINEQSALQQMEEEFKKLAARDQCLGAARVRRRNAIHAMERANQSARVRIKQLREIAVERVQKRLNIRIIPGYKNPNPSVRKDVRKMAKQLRTLIEQNDKQQRLLTSGAGSEEAPQQP